MNHKTLIICLALISSATASLAGPNDVPTLIRIAQERNAKVRSATAIVEARRAAFLGAKAPVPAHLELSPGLGFTNGTIFLGQEFGLYGRRKSATALAKSDIVRAEFELAQVKSDVSYEVVKTVAALLVAADEKRSALSAQESAKALEAAVTKRHELGEAPRVHVSRAELEVLRANQSVHRANGHLESAAAGVQSLVGYKVDAEDVIWPQGNRPTLAGLSSFDLVMAAEDANRARIRIQAVRSESLPTLSAGLTTDVWSLDRGARGRFGVQVAFRLPVFGNGKARSAEKESQLESEASRNLVNEAVRQAKLREQQAETGWTAAALVAYSFEGEVLPKGESMLTAMRDGYTAGLVSLVEVLEAQQTLIKLRQERDQALYALRLAEIELWRATPTTTKRDLFR